MANNINYGPVPRSKVYDVTLLALSWLGASSPYTYIISTITSINSNAIVHIIPSPNITPAEYTSYTNAKIISGGIDTSGYVNLKAVGTKPIINLPVRIIVSESIFVESKYELNTFPASSTLEAGLIAIATDAEVKLGINNTKAVTPLILSDNYLKKTGGTLTGALTGTTITGNTITATTFNGRLIGNVTGNVTGNVSGSSGSCTGNAATATTASSCTGNSATATKAYTTANTADTLYLIGVTSTTSGNQSLQLDASTYVTNTGYLYATRVYNAVYNDYAECFDNKELTYTEAKNKIVELDENNNTVLAKENSNMIIGVVSDSFGHMLGGTEEEIQEGSKMPIGLAGVLYVDSLDRVDIKNRGKFITSGGNGLAKVLDTPISGSTVGKIIDIDEVNNRYKVIITLM
jgi:hypothetical protein